jgi:hypothetical protein
MTKLADMGFSSPCWCSSSAPGARMDVALPQRAAEAILRSSWWR